MEQNIQTEKEVRKALFNLTHNVGYGSEKLEKVIKDFMQDYKGGMWDKEFDNEFDSYTIPL